MYMYIKSEVDVEITNKMKKKFSSIKSLSMPRRLGNKNCILHKLWLIKLEKKKYVCVWENMNNPYLPSSTKLITVAIPSKSNV